jgi:hypothetical protein
VSCARPRTGGKPAAAPAREFFMVLRMYEPEERMYDGDYVVPPVEPRS